MTLNKIKYNLSLFNSKEPFASFDFIRSGTGSALYEWGSYRTLNQKKVLLKVLDSESNLTNLYYEKRTCQNQMSFKEKCWVKKTDAGYACYRFKLDSWWLEVLLPNDVSFVSMGMPLMNSFPIFDEGLKRMEGTVYELDESRLGKWTGNRTQNTRSIECLWESRNHKTKQLAFQQNFSEQGVLETLEFGNVQFKRITSQSSASAQKFIDKAAKLIIDLKFDVLDDARIEHILQKQYFVPSKKAKLALKVDHAKQDKAIVLLLHGSGPEDADSGSGSELRDYSFNSVNMFKSLSKSLSREGFHVARYDKRGVNQSSGDWKDVCRTDLVEDAESVVRFLSKKYKNLPIFVFGVSEGANISVTLSHTCESILSGVLLGGCPAGTLDEVVVTKLKNMLGEDFKKVKHPYLEFIQNLKNVCVSYEDDLLLKRFSEGFSLLWWKEMLLFEPRKDLRKTSVPLLFLHGSDDLEVLPSQGKEMYEKAKMLGNNAEWKVFEGFNHFFQKSYPAIPRYEYGIPYPPQEKLVSFVSAWLNKYIGNA